MAPVSHLLAFVIALVIMIAVPGPSVLFTISRALTVGRRAAAFTVLGNAAAACVHVVLVAAGLGLLLVKASEVVTGLKLAGAAYLIFLGVQAIRHRHSMAEALAAKVNPVGPWRALRDGFLVGLTNPKVIVFLVVALPAAADPNGALPVQVQMLVLGGLFPVFAIILDSIWAAAAGTARHWFARSPRRMAAIGGAGGLTMIGLGVTAAFSGRK